MLRLELYTGLGVYMTPGYDRMADAEYLADSFVGGQLYEDLLAEAVSYTRILEGWFATNPTFHSHLSTNVPLVFQTLCLHVGFRRRLSKTHQKSVDGTVPDWSEIYDSIDRDTRVCLRVFKAYGKKSASLTPLANLAHKIAAADDMHVTVAEVEVARDAYRCQGAIQLRRSKSSRDY